MSGNSAMTLNERKAGVCSVTTVSTLGRFALGLKYCSIVCRNELYICGARCRPHSALQQRL